MVLYLGAMSGVNQSTIEAAQIDGVGVLGRLWHVILPAIWPTVTVFIMAGFAGYFTNQGATFSFSVQARRQKMKAIPSGIGCLYWSTAQNRKRSIRSHPRQGGIYHHCRTGYIAFQAIVGKIRTARD